jgi:hypothetical protein
MVAYTVMACYHWQLMSKPNGNEISCCVMSKKKNPRRVKSKNLVFGQSEWLSI